MELNEQEIDRLGEYMSAYEVLIGDRRSGGTFQAVIEGIIGSESLRAAQIGRFSPCASQGQMG